MQDCDLNSRVEKILRGSFDLHVHAGPDPIQDRRLDALDTAQHAYQAEMAGFVLKSHYYPTASLAQMLNRVYPDLIVAGSIVLNNAVGGLNPDAVKTAADLGSKIIWMPTHSADFYLSSHNKGTGIRLTDNHEKLSSQLYPILSVAQRYDMAIASGHVSATEAIAMFKAARDCGVERLIATHPLEIASVEELNNMIALGAYIECAFLHCMPLFNKTTPEKLVSMIRTLGVEHCVITTDFGQSTNPPPAEGMRMAIGSLLQAGLGVEELTTLVKTNPLKLVGK